MFPGVRELKEEGGGWGVAANDDRILPERSSQSSENLSVTELSV